MHCDVRFGSKAETYAVQKDKSALPLGADIQKLFATRMISEACRAVASSIAAVFDERTNTRRKERRPRRQIKTRTEGQSDGSRRIVL
jgi:hypothetical protein